jgi:glycosyltransferase involved in cell wall biosynthesis
VTSPRTLIVGNFLSSHGASRGVCEELAPRLRESGWTVLTTSDRRRKLARLADMLSSIWQRRDNYDVAQVDVYSGPAFRWAEAACWLLRRIGKPYVLTLHGGGLPEFAKTERRRVQRLLRHAKAVTVPSQYLLHQMAENREDLTHLPNGLQVAAYAARRPRQTLQPRLIWLRAFHNVYNPTMAVRVIARLKNEFPSIQLTMVGPDKGDFSREGTLAVAEIHDVLPHLRVQDSIPKAQVPDLLSTGDVFLNTTNVDNTPVSVLEAMASGLCVVSTNVGGIPYLLQSGQDGLLVPADDDKAMAAEVRRLLTDGALAKRIQAASLNKVRRFDWGTVLPQWQRILTSAAQGDRRRAGAPVPSSAL